MEEFFDLWTKWKNEKYHTRKHGGLKEAGEKWLTPIEMFENGPRYEKAAPPREYAAMLLMKADKGGSSDGGNGAKQVVIQKLLIPVDLKKIKDLQQLLELLKEVEDFANANESEETADDPEAVTV